MMPVKCLIVNEKGLFLDQLVKELIAQGIDYVQIENEFHFNNQVYRFYSPEEVTKEIIESDENTVMGLEIISEKPLMDVEGPKVRKGKKNSGKTPTYNKTLIKRQNKETNKYLRGNIRK